MEIYVGVISAIIAAIVSIIVAMVSAYTSRKRLQVERENLERKLQRTLTARLYDLRLDAYPEAIAITDGLRRSRLLAHEVSLTEDYFGAIIEGLDQWQNTKAGFLLSENALKSLNELRSCLREKPQGNGVYSQDQLERFRSGRRAFRVALRSDIVLLYTEEAHDSR